MKGLIAAIGCLAICLPSATALAGDMGSLEGLRSGFYGGLGASYISLDEKFTSNLRTNTLNSATDQYQSTHNHLAPTFQLGYWAPLNPIWLWGLAVQWSYLGYNTSNVNTSRGQFIPNATFSSINIFGPNIMRDFSSQTSVRSEGVALLYVGEQLQQGYLYVGLGPTLFPTTNNIYVSSVHTTPNGPGDHLNLYLCRSP